MILITNLNKWKPIDSLETGQPSICAGITIALSAISLPPPQSYCLDWMAAPDPLFVKKKLPSWNFEGNALFLLLFCPQSHIVPPWVKLCATLSRTLWVKQFAQMPLFELFRQNEEMRESCEMPHHVDIILRSNYIKWRHWITPEMTACALIFTFWLVLKLIC